MDNHTLPEITQWSRVLQYDLGNLKDMEIIQKSFITLYNKELGVDYGGTRAWDREVWW